MRYPSINQLYSDFFGESKGDHDASQFWNEIPNSIHDILLKNKKLLLSKTLDNGISVAQRDVYQQFEISHKNRKSWTDAVKHTASNLFNNAIEGAHQTVALGGPAYVINKIACTWRISQLTKFSPYFFVADYDRVQPELINAHLPGLSSHGYNVSVPIPQGYEYSPVYVIPVPEEKWLRERLNEIYENYSSMIKGQSQTIKNRVLGNLDHITNIFLSTYFQSTTMGEWTTRILDNIINIELNLGIPLLVSSDFRHLYQGGFEFLLANKNRKKFIQSMNTAHTTIKRLKYTPSVKPRSADYTPFFYECPNPDCYKSRIKMLTIEKINQLEIQGICPQCNQEISFTVSAIKPDLTEHIEHLSPRVDTRQILVSMILPILVHVGGPGEASYYAQVIPAMKEMGVSSPYFYRYIRSFYNTPWNEKDGLELESQGYPILTSKPLFTALRKWAKATRKEERASLLETQREIKTQIHSVHSMLHEEINKTKAMLESVNRQEGEKSKRKIIQNYILRINLLQKYLTNAFGEYDPLKFGQEVSFSWLDLATLTGIKQLFHTYARIYSSQSPPEGYFFMNIRII